VKLASIDHLPVWQSCDGYSVEAAFADSMAGDNHLHAEYRHLRTGRAGPGVLLLRWLTPSKGMPSDSVGLSAVRLGALMATGRRSRIGEPSWTSRQSCLRAVH
jgi:hypothetical protein